MLSRTAIPLATGLLIVAPLVGCGSDDATPSQTARPGDYLTAVQELLNPATRLAEAAAADLREPGGARPRRADLIELVTTARVELRMLQALPLADPARDRQRDRLAARFPSVIAQMRRLVDALVGEDRAAVRRAAGAYFRTLRSLPSALDASSPSR